MRPVVHRNLQADIAECGLACLAVCAQTLGSDINLGWLRQTYPASSRGASLQDLSRIAGGIGLATRSVRCEQSELRDLQLPAILHWNFEHFVVLEAIRRDGLEIFDPARGRRRVNRDEVSRSFTGVAMEVRAAPSFRRRTAPAPLRLSSLLRFSPAILGGLAQALMLSLVLEAYVILSPLYLQIAVDHAALKGDMDLLVALAVGFALFAIVNAGAEALRSVALQRASALLSWDMTQRLFHHMVRLPLPWFQRRRLTDALTRFEAIGPVRDLFANGFIAVLIDGAMSVATLVMMVLFAPQLAAVTIVSLVLYVIVRLLSVPLSMRLSGDLLQHSIVEQSKRLETLRAIQTIKVMGAEQDRESDWANKYADLLGAVQKSGIVHSILNTLQSLIDALTTVVVVYMGIKAIFGGQMTVGILYAFLSYRGQFMKRTVSIFENVIGWRLLDVYAFRLSDVVLTPVEEGISRSHEGLAELDGAIELSHVSFRYAPTDPFVLKDVSVRIASGEFVAIVGPSGCGKSTLLKVLCGLYPATSGEIRIDGLPLAVWGPTAVRNALGAVMQDDELLPGSIAENVAFFAPNVDIERVWACLKDAEIEDDIRRMPMGIHSHVGDMGSALSGGQKQRVLMARALYRQPRILVLDEAMSHLDVDRERAISQRLGSLQRTRIVVAHRPETIAAADRVLLLLNGTLSELRRQDAPAPSGAPIGLG